MNEQEQQLITRSDASVSFVPQAETMKTAALERSAIVNRVRNSLENEAAVEAQKEIKRVLDLAEASRVALKAPVLEIERKIDSVAKEFAAPLKEEQLRLGKLLGDFQALEAARIKSEEAARIEEINDLERQRQEDLSMATSFDERDAIQHRYNEAALAVPMPKAVRAEGQVVKDDFEIVVEDHSLLARLHYPEMCSVTPKLGAIKEALRRGEKVYGIKATLIQKAGVRVGKEKAAITV